MRTSLWTAAISAVLFLAACSHSPAPLCQAEPTLGIETAFNQGLQLGASLSCEIGAEASNQVHTPKVAHQNSEKFSPAKEIYQEASATPRPKLRYRTSCTIKDGRAVGYLHNLQKQTLRYKGEVHFDLFDRQGQFVRRSTAYAIGSTPWDFNLEMQSIEVREHEASCELIANEALVSNSSGS